MNKFTFNSIHHLHIKGCAMGTIFAPAYANIFKGKFEKLHIYAYIRNISTFYCRFIDNIFIFWNGTELELTKFMGNLNKHCKFEFTYSKTSITFLDTKI